jgi:hypothetical protein
MNIQIKSGQSKNVVLIELGGSHAECLHTQIHYLATAGYRVYLICDEIVWSQIGEKQRLSGSQVYPSRRNIIQHIAMMFKIRRYLREYKICFMVINTIEVSAIRDICFFSLPRKLNCTGLLHNADKLTTGRSLRLFIGKRVKKIFVLSEYIRQKCQLQTKYKLAAFYPIYFPEFAPVSFEKSADEIWITIPGAVETLRRDYIGLLQNLKEKGLHHEVRIIFLGKLDVGKYPDVASLLEQISALKYRITVFKEFVDNSVFHSYVRQSDLILPLLHPTGGSTLNAFYGNHRISGSFNLSFSYKIPMLIEQGMMQYDDFKDCSFFYKAEDLVDIINSFVHRKQELKAMREAMLHNARWEETNLLHQYVRFVEL